MKLAFITINYNASAATLRLLESLRVQQDNDFEVYVVDNASQENDVRALEAGLLGMPPTFHLIKSKQNTGFSGGNNIGIRAALEQGAEWVVLINNDAWVKSQFIAGVKAFTSCRAGQIVAFPIQEGGRIAYCGEVRWLHPWGEHVYNQDHALEILKQGKAYAIGAGMAIHATVFDLIGFWNERYFLYFEDMDFSVRALRAGIQLDIAPHAVHHEVSLSTGKLGSSLLLRYHYRNAHLFNGINGSMAIKIVLPIWSLFVILKQVIKIVLLPKKRKESKAILNGVLDFWQRKFGRIT